MRFAPRYFAGVKANGRPRWTRDEAKAAPLALDGVVGGDPHEALPQPLQMGIGWVGAPLSKWVMLYGGDLADYLLADPASSTPGPAPGARAHPLRRPAVGTVERVAPDPRARRSRRPSAIRTDRAACSTTPSASTWDRTSARRPIRRARSTSSTRAAARSRSSSTTAASTAPNLIDAYTGPDGEGGVELVWNVSTWNPYGVLYLRTRIEP